VIEDFDFNVLIAIIKDNKISENDIDSLKISPEDLIEALRILNDLKIVNDFEIYFKWRSDDEMISPHSPPPKIESVVFLD